MQNRCPVTHIMRFLETTAQSEEQLRSRKLSGVQFALRPTMFDNDLFVFAVFRRNHVWPYPGIRRCKKSGLETVIHVWYGGTQRLTFRVIL